MLTYERKYQQFEPLTLTVTLHSFIHSFIILVLFQFQVRMLMNVWVKRSSDGVEPPIFSIHELQ